MLSIRVPPLGESIVEATISRWTKKEGDSVASGETLVELETDKVTVEVPALKAGVLVRRNRVEGDVVKVGDVLGEVDETASAPSQVSAAAITPDIAPVSPRQVAPVAAPVVAAEVRASPAAVRLSAESGVALSGILGTGRGGVVSKPDLIEQSATRPATPAGLTLAHPSAPAPVAVAPVPPPAPATAPAAPAAAPLMGVRETREKMTTRRKRMAEHLLEAQHATAHLTTFNEIDMTAVESLRARINPRLEKEQGFKLSMMPFFVRAACIALKQYPVINARIDGESIVYHHYVNMGIAVSADAGLVVPSLKEADRMTMPEIAKAIAAVAKKARDGKLAMDDLTGGTFTITNGGVFGSLVSTPIINFPQMAILGLHKVQDRPMVVNGEIVVRPMMYVALSYDHRVIDGQNAVLFLVKVKELMEDPGLMAVG